MNFKKCLKKIFEFATSTNILIKNIMKLNIIDKNKTFNEQIISSSNCSKITNSCDSVRITASGNYTKITASGNYTKITTSGECSMITSSGSHVKIESSGNYVKITSFGNYTEATNFGGYAKITTSGDYAKITNFGAYAKIINSGVLTQVDNRGHKSIIASIGPWSIAKGQKGSWITLAEYRQDENEKIYPYFVKTECVDGVRIKEDTYYGLYNKEFREVITVDGVEALLIESKLNVKKVVLKADIEESFVFTKNNISAHGYTVKQAYRDWLFKQSDRDVSKYNNLDKNKKYSLEYWYECYRIITGACALGVENFIEQHKPKKEMTLDEVIQITKGQYGHNTFVEFFNNKE